MREEDQLLSSKFHSAVSNLRGAQPYTEPDNHLSGQEMAGDMPSPSRLLYGEVPSIASDNNFGGVRSAQAYLKPSHYPSASIGQEEFSRLQQTGRSARYFSQSGYPGADAGEMDLPKQEYNDLIQSLNEQITSHQSRMISTLMGSDLLIQALN